METSPAEHRARFDEIFHAYSGLILAYAARRVRDGEDAADVLAETFSVAWRRIDDIPAGELARPWLYAVARRVVANHRRGAVRKERLHERLTSEVSRLVQASIRDDASSDGEAIAAAFARLSESDREILSLIAWEGLDRDDVARVIGCTRATVRVRLHRARARFERELGRLGVQRTPATGHDRGMWAIAHVEPEEAP